MFVSRLARLTDLHGYITDGAGNYSVGVKCSWLIDARIRAPNQQQQQHNRPHSNAADAAVLSKAGSGAAEPTTIVSTAVASVESEVKQPIIRLHLEEFATECGWDHLYVYDGDSVNSPLLAIFR